MDGCFQTPVRSSLPPTADQPNKQVSGHCSQLYNLQFVKLTWKSAPSFTFSFLQTRLIIYIRIKRHFSSDTCLQMTQYMNKMTFQVTLVSQWHCCGCSNNIRKVNSRYDFSNNTSKPHVQLFWWHMPKKITGVVFLTTCSSKWRKQLPSKVHR